MLSSALRTSHAHPPRSDPTKRTLPERIAARQTPSLLLSVFRESARNNLPPNVKDGAINSRGAHVDSRAQRRALQRGDGGKIKRAAVASEIVVHAAALDMLARVRRVVQQRGPYLALLP